MRYALALVVEVVDWLRPAFASAGYVIVAVAMFLESAAFVGVLIPGDVILAVGGVYAANGTLSLPLVIVIGTVFGVLGETAGYLLGRRYGESLLKRAPIIGRFSGRIDRTRDAIGRNGGKAIVLGRFATGVAGTVPFVAGTSDVPLRTFLLFTVPTTAVWAAAVTLLGYVVGNNVETIDRILSTFGLAVLTIVVLAAAGVWLWRKRQAAAS